MTRTSNDPIIATRDHVVGETADMEAAWQELDQAIRAANRILLSTHENPDGDGIGSQLAFYEHLESLGKECRILNYTEVPTIYEFLDPNGWIEVYDPERDELWLAACDLAIVFDLGNFRRLETVGRDLIRHNVATAAIDHHPQDSFEGLENEPLYRYLILDYSAPSTGTLVWQYLQTYRSEPLTNTMAEALYTALVTDTGSFKYDNTDERAHLMAIDLLKAGVKPYNIHRQVYEQREHSQVNLLGVLTNNLQYSGDGRIGWCALTQDMLAGAGATRKDVDGFSDFIRTIKGVEVAVLLTEADGGKTKVNLRSKGNLAINDVAQKLGGGGHPFASGAFIEQPWGEVIEILLPLLEEKVKTLDNVEEGSIGGS
ncbi:MAG: bifunctional oligoribonuclease/PAP phosphatase NrnA [Fidelibacterota bacterium]|nr:MAG: bifunctional oligoribonuclease/PAP phosphatase NrnA [Candidatus Neomarinimicrobiota bacterium]